MGGLTRIETTGLTCAFSAPTTTAFTPPASKTLEAIARALSDDVWVVAPETDQSGVVAFALAQRSAAPARNLRPAFRREGHADRLRHHGRAPSHARDEARSRPLRRQPGPERRRGRELFGHGRGRHRGHDPRRAVHRAVAGLRRRRAQGHSSGTAPSITDRRSCASILDAGIDKGILVNVNFPDCEPDEVVGAAVVNQGVRTQELLSSTSARTGAAIRISGSASSAVRSRPATAPICGPSPTGASRSRLCVST